MVRDRPPRLILDAARRAFATAPGLARGTRPCRPTPVRTPAGELSYWLVPGRGDGGARALARILADGRVATVAALAGAATDAAAVVTGLGAGEARRAIDAVLADEPGGAASEAMLVHDGPVVREAWLAELTRPGEPPQWVFATGGGTYRRAVGGALGGASPELA